MNTPIIDRDLTKQARTARVTAPADSPSPTAPRINAAPASPERWANIITIVRWTTCSSVSRASPARNSKPPFKPRKNYEDVGAWLLANGTKKTPAEIKAWSDEMEAGSMMKNPEKRAFFTEECKKLGLDPEKEQHVRLARSRRPREFQEQGRVTVLLPDCGSVRCGWRLRQATECGSTTAPRKPYISVIT